MEFLRGLCQYNISRNSQKQYMNLVMGRRGSKFTGLIAVWDG